MCIHPSILTRSKSFIHSAYDHFMSSTHPLYPSLCPAAPPSIHPATQTHKKLFLSPFFFLRSPKFNSDLQFHPSKALKHHTLLRDPPQRPFLPRLPSINPPLWPHLQMAQPLPSISTETPTLPLLFPQPLALCNPPPVPPPSV